MATEQFSNKTMKTTASKNSQKVILKNIAEKINKSLAIFNRHDEEENNDRAEVNDDQVRVIPAETVNFFSGIVMEIVMKVISQYRKKYENLIWYIETKPVLKWDKNHEMYWTNAPVVIINFIY